MTRKQVMRVHTASGVEEIDADRLLVENDEYILLRGDDEVRRIPIEDVATGTDPETGEEIGGITTIFSKS